MNNLPKTVREEIKDRVYRICDEEGYMTNGRVQNATFISRLVDDPKVGRIIAEFMPEDQIRTYIKDAVLNRYSKDKRCLDEETFTEWVSNFLGEAVNLLSKKNDVWFYRSESNTILVASVGTYVKWETALRKILLYIGANPQIQESGATLRKMIVVLTTGAPIPSGEEEVLKKALCEVDIEVLVK